MSAPVDFSEPANKLLVERYLAKVPVTLIADALGMPYSSAMKRLQIARDRGLIPALNRRRKPTDLGDETNSRLLSMFVEGKPYGAIAEALGLSPTTVRVRILKAKKKGLVPSANRAPARIPQPESWTVLMEAAHKEMAERDRLAFFNKTKIDGWSQRLDYTP